MGDPRRFEAFARFIHRTFPAAATVADVAGGHGELAFWLAELGLRPVIIDPRPATFPRWIHRTLRKRAVRDGRPAGIERVIQRVEDADLHRFDLLVALHPDAATEPVVRTAVAQGIDFAVVPCCVFPLDGLTRSREAWMAYLAALAPGARVSALPIGGANAVLWRRTRSGEAGRYPLAPAGAPAERAPTITTLPSGSRTRAMRSPHGCSAGSSRIGTPPARSRATAASQSAA